MFNCTRCWLWHPLLTDALSVFCLKAVQWGQATRARMHHKVVGNFGSEADVRNLYFRGFRFNEILTTRMYSRSTGEENSSRVLSSLLRKCTRLPNYAYEVRALTFEVSDNFGSNDVRPCGAYGPRWGSVSARWWVPDSLVPASTARDRLVGLVVKASASRA